LFKTIINLSTQGTICDKERVVKIIKNNSGEVYPEKKGPDQGNNSIYHPWVYKTTCVPGAPDEACAEGGVSQGGAGRSPANLGICEKCGNQDVLLFHHVSYIPEKVISVCKKCHWTIHAPELGRKYIRKPWNCPLRHGEELTINDTCYIRGNCGDCKFSFRIKFPGCKYPGSNSTLRQERRKRGLCEWHASTCEGIVRKCPACPFSYCEYHMNMHYGEEY
jgi:hypothetical protein